MLTQTSKNLLRNAGRSRSTIQTQEGSQGKSQKSSEKGILPSIPEYVPDYGIITSGSCATPEKQRYFDDHVAGRPPQAA